MSNWISVKDRLPETSRGFDLLIRSAPVLVYGEYTKGEKKHIFGARLYGNEWHSADGKCGEISHWQPFPEPPKE